MVGIIFRFKVIACIVMLFGLVSLGAKSLEYKIDKAKSIVHWQGNKVVGSHRGSIRIKSGTIKKTGKSFTGVVIMDMNTIICSDIKDEVYNQKLIAHLKSKDFFHTRKNKTAKLVLTEAVKKNGDLYKIKAKVTINGITQNTEFTAKINFKKNNFIATGKINLDRTKFGIRYKSGKFFKALGDKLIYDVFTLRFSIRSAN